MAKKFYGSLDLQTNSSLILRETDNTFGISLKAAASLAADLTITLPSTVTADGVISSNGSGVLSSALLVDANVSASAAISLSKLAALTVDRALVSDGSGFVSASSVTATELEYVSGVTSALQTQLDGKAADDLSDLTVASLASESLLVGSSSSAVAALAVGSDGQILSVVGGSVAWAAPSSVPSFKTDWETADTATFAITHSLNTLDVKIEIYDKASGETIEVDSVTRTSVNVVTVTASEAPPAGAWRVLILAA